MIPLHLHILACQTEKGRLHQQKQREEYQKRRSEKMFCPITKVRIDDVPGGCRSCLLYVTLDDGLITTRECTFTSIARSLHKISQK
jgi:uncharacterized protein YbaR (Trm112 family)